MRAHLWSLHHLIPPVTWEAWLLPQLQLLKYTHRQYGNTISLVFFFLFLWWIKTDRYLMNPPAMPTRILTWILGNPLQCNAEHWRWYCVGYSLRWSMMRCVSSCPGALECTLGTYWRWLIHELLLSLLLMDMLASSFCLHVPYEQTHPNLPCRCVLAGYEQPGADFRAWLEGPGQGSLSGFTCPVSASGSKMVGRGTRRWPVCLGKYGKQQTFAGKLLGRSNQTSNVKERKEEDAH